MTIILSNLDRLKKFTGRFLSKFAVKWILKVPPHLVYVAILPCETLLSAKQAINDKLQGCLSTYLRCGGVVKFFRSVKICQNYGHESVAALVWPTLYDDISPWSTQRVDLPRRASDKSTSEY